MFRVTSAQLTNFRSISESSTLHFGNFNVIIGKNNVGKSNLLKGLHQALLLLQTKSFIGTLTAGSDELVFGEGDIASIFLEGEATLRSVPMKFQVLVEIGRRSAGASFWITKLKVFAKDVKDDVKYSLDLEETRQDDLRQFFNDLHDSRDDKNSSVQFANSFYSDMTRTIAEVVTAARQRRWQPDAQAFVDIHENQPTWSLDQVKEFQKRLQEITTAHNAALEADYKELFQAAKLQADGLLPDSDALGIFPQDSYATGDVRQPFGTKELDQLFKLFTERTQIASQRRFANTVGDLLGTTIAAYKNGDQSVIHLGDYLHTSSGSGIRGALRLISDLYLKKPPLALIEEPELHLHPTLSRDIASYLRSLSSHTQMFITTHSAEFLDSEHNDSVLLLDKQSSTTVIKEAPLRTRSGEIARAIGLRPSSILMNERVVLVEGRTDEEILRAVGRVMQTDAFNGSGFIHLNGGKNHHFVAQDMLDHLGSQQIKVHCVLDKDEMLDEEIWAVQTRFEENENVELHVWKRREIENYLLDPIAISKHIHLKMVRGGVRAEKPSPEDVSTFLKNETSVFKAEVTRLRARAALLRPTRFGADLDTDDMVSELTNLSADLARKALDATATIRRISAEVDSLPSDEIVRVVPGHFILERFYRRYEVAYHKGDGAELAALIDKEAVPTEIKRFLASLHR